MVDVIEVPPPAVDASGNLTIFWVPTIADILAPKAATEVKAAGSKRLTYSFLPGGWNTTGEQTINTDERLTLPVDLTSLGKTSQDLTLQYVDSTDAGSAAVVLVPGTSGYFVERRNLPNQTDAAAGQKVRVFKVTLGAQIFDPIGDGKFTISQKVAISNVVGQPVALAA